MKISASLFLTDILPHKRRLYHRIVKSKIFNKTTPAVVFDALKKCGIDGVEILLPSFTPTSDRDILEVKEVLDVSKMPVLSLHQKLRFFTRTRGEEIKQIFHMADMLGAKVIVLHTSTAGKQLFNATYLALLHSLEKKYGITIGFENMEKYAGSFLTPYRWHPQHFAKLMEEIDFNITFDTTHLAHSGGDLTTFFKANKKRIVNIHLSDYKHHVFNSSFRPMRYKHLALGKGELPMRAFVSMLAKEKYQGLLTMEINSDLVGICESAEIISAALKGQHEEKKI